MFTGSRHLIGCRRLVSLTLGRLDEHDRVVVVLADGAGWACPDIAARCGIAEAAGCGCGRLLDEA